MQRNKIDYTVSYRDSGTKEVTFTIDFISNSAIKDYQEMLDIMEKTRENSDKIDVIVSEIGMIMTDKNKKLSEKRELVKKKGIEKDKLIDEIVKISNDGFFERRYSLVKKILEKNNVNDEYFLSKDFWFECVDDKTIIDFLAKVISVNLPKGGKSGKKKTLK